MKLCLGEVQNRYGFGPLILVIMCARGNISIPIIFYRCSGLFQLPVKDDFPSPKNY